MLFSVTSDIWNSANNYNAFGKERIYLNLLLRHCNIALDVLGEQELDRSLQNYSLLFAVDSHLKKEYAATIEKWVKSGGTLYVGAGALQFDENNQPLGLLEKLGIAPEKLTIRQIPGRGDHELINHKPLKTFKNMSLTVGMNSVLQKERRCGKGKVICIGFFPGLSYIGGTIRKNKDEYSILSWPSAHREFIASLALPIKPRLLSDDFLVEANLLEDHSGDVIVLSNWKGKETTVTLTLRNAGKYRSIVGAGVQVIDTRRNGDTLTVKVKTAAGGYVLCRK